MELIRRGKLMSVYKKLVTKQYEGTEESIEKEMIDNAMRIFSFHVENNEKYRAFLNDKGFDYSDLNSITWTDIPFIDKSILKKYDPIVKSEVYKYSNSGGSTNVPFTYPSCIDSSMIMWPNHWVLHNEFDIKPYDKMLMLMAYGEKQKSLTKYIYHKLSNFVTFNSFDFSNERMLTLYKLIKKNNILVIYGYSSSINQFLRFLSANDLHLNLKGIVGTSDNMIKDSYQLAKKYCNCEIYNQYGAHDGDIFSFECKYHAGLHIQHDCCSVEIINNEIILTSTKNKSYPFIRYKVGDISSKNELIKEKCQCGRTLFRLPDIAGRNTYFIQLDDGSQLPIMYFTYPFDDNLNIDQYQVYHQNNILHINFISNVYSLEDLNNKYLDSIINKIGNNIIFVLNEHIYKLPNGKVPIYINLDTQNGEN